MLDESGPSVSKEDPSSLGNEANVDGPRLIVGLGNPGRKYRRTRHNYGFFVVDELARRVRLEPVDLCSADYFSTDGAPSSRSIHLAKPQTFMNRSGLATRCLAQRFGYAPENVLVVYDDVNLPLGKQRMRPGGSAGGHRGLESVIENLRTDQVPRLRLGIASAVVAGELNPLPDLAQFVLEPFEEHEVEQVSACVLWAADACEAWLRYGIDRTMSQFNGSLPIGGD